MSFKHTPLVSFVFEFNRGKDFFSGKYFEKHYTYLNADQLSTRLFRPLRNPTKASRHRFFEIS